MHGLNCIENMHACMAKPYSLQVRIFIEKDKCIERLRRKTAKQVINDYAGRRIIL